MRTRELRDDAGQITGFTVSNVLITRSAIQRVVEHVPGVSVRKSTRAWRWHADDDFVHFTLNGRTFIAWEPYGDSDAYWIYAEDGKPGPEIEIVRGAFERHRVWGII